MKSRLMTVLVLMSSVLYAQVIFQQNFDCASADKAGCLSGADAFTIENGSIDYGFVAESGNRAVHSGNHKDASWAVDVSAQKQAGKTIYVSFIARCLSDKCEGRYAGLGLFKGDEEQFGIGNDYGSKYLSYYDKEGEFRIGEFPLNVDNEAHLFVAKFEFKNDETDSFTVWLDPLVDRSLDDQDRWRTASGNYELDFDQIRIRAGHENYKWEYDEIKVGESWEDVVTRDNLPGGKVLAATAKAQPAGTRETVLQGVNRFLAKGVKMKDVPASLAVCAEFDKPKKINGKVKMEPVFSAANGRKYAYIKTALEDDFYGTGEVTGGIRRNGYRITLNNKDNYCYNDTDNLYQSHPWVIGVRPDGTAYGVIFDTTWKSELDLHSGILFSVPEGAKDFPVYVLEADSPAKVVAMLGEMTGKMPLPPRWALGYQQCRFSYYPDARAREVATGFRERQIPCDVLWFDIHYMDGYRIFTFDKKLFPDPSATNQYLHDIGFKSVWMIDPGVKLDPGYFVYDSGSKIDAWVKMPNGKPFVGKVWPGDCVFPDFTRPEVRQWWAGLYKDYMAQGVDGVWNDMNDPSVFDGPNGTMADEALHVGGGELGAGPHEQYHNAYGYLMTEASHDGIQAANPDKRPFVLTRSNYLGGQRFAATWTGDNIASWDNMKVSVPMSITLSISGTTFNGPDIGGFLSNATPELWSQWISMGAFFPFCRAHTVDGSNNQEPWEFGEKAEKASRVALEKRYMLMPYLYTLFRGASVNGSAVMNPIFFADPSDSALRSEDKAFMLGEELIIVPAWAEGVQMPKNGWQKISLMDESQWDEFQVDMFQKQGTIIPVGRKVQSTAEIKAQDELTLCVVTDASGKATGKLYEDAGEGYAYKSGEYAESAFTASVEGDELVVRLDSVDGKMSYDKRFVKIAWCGKDGVSYGFGDICNGIKVKKTNFNNSVTK